MSALRLKDVDANDNGKYTVVVENEHAKDTSYSSVAVEGSPEPPADSPNVADVSPTSVTLSWYGSAYDGGSIITGYIVEMRHGKETQWQTVTSNCLSTSYKVKNLVPGSQYVFRIRTQNVHGVSVPSKESETVYLFDESCDSAENINNGLIIQHRIVSIESGTNFLSRYKKEEEIGRGRFGTVYRLLDTESELVCAGKFIKCIKQKDKQKVRDEVDVMNGLDHPKLLQLIAAFENPRDIIMIVEYIAGGELFERVAAEDFVLTERDSILFMRQICEGVRYMHDKRVIHLDLKPENILCLSRHSHQIKLIDFGLARYYDPNEPLRVMFGTPEFVPPEVINYEPVSPASDMWSVGVICYVLLTGLSPFMGDNDAETFSNITRAEFDFEDEAFDNISKEAKNFISELLVKKKEKRLTAQQCLRNQWLAQQERTMSTLQLSTSKLKKFLIRRKWQKSGNAIRAIGRMVSLSGIGSQRESWTSKSQSSKSFSESIENDSKVCANTDEKPSPNDSSFEEESITDLSSSAKDCAKGNEDAQKNNNEVKEQEINSQFDKKHSVPQQIVDTLGLGEKSIKLNRNVTPTNNQDMIIYKSRATCAITENLSSKDQQTNGSSSGFQHQAKSPLSSPTTTDARVFSKFGVKLRHNSRPLTSPVLSPTSTTSTMSSMAKFSHQARMSNFAGDALIAKKLPEKLVVKAGSMARLEVNVESKLRVQVTWFKDDEQLYEDRRRKFSAAGNGIFALLILKVSANDQGIYKCKVKSGEVVLTTQGELRVNAN